MTINQISVFLENKPGQLAEFTRLLEENQIDMRALSIAETQDFGILRLIVDDPYKTVNVVKEAGYICAVTPVLAVELSDKPGSLVKLLTALGEGGINVEYSYAFIARKKDVAYMAFRVNDPEKAVGGAGSEPGTPAVARRLVLFVQRLIKAHSQTVSSNSKGIQQGFRWMPFSMPVFPMRFGSISAAIVTKRRQTISSPSGRKQSIQIPSDNAWLTVIKHGSCKGDG